MRLRWSLPLMGICLTGLAVFVPARVWAGEECRAEDRVEVSLSSWKAALKRAVEPGRRAEVLDELKLSLEAVADDDASDAGDETAAADTANATLISVDDFPVRLGGGDRADRVIYVRYLLEGAGQKTTVHLVQVLRPAWGQTYCVLGSDLSRRDRGDAHLENYSLAFVPLVNAKTKAVEVEAVEAGTRSSETRRQYWVADGPKLRKVFDQPISGMDSAAGKTTARTGKLELAGGFPRRIELKQNVKRTACDVSDGEAACDDKEQSSSQVFVYDGTRYIRRR